MIKVYRCYNSIGLAEFANKINWHRIEFESANFERDIYLTANDDKSIRALIIFMEIKPKLYEVHVAKTDLSVIQMKDFADVALRILNKYAQDSNLIGIIEKTNRAACFFARRMGFESKEVGDYNLFTGGCGNG